ncbi:hypothetical protein D3C72_2452640 [compost metagenome]
MGDGGGRIASLARGRGRGSKGTDLLLVAMLRYEKVRRTFLECDVVVGDSFVLFFNLKQCFGSLATMARE